MPTIRIILNRDLIEEIENTIRKALDRIAPGAEIFLDVREEVSAWGTNIHSKRCHSIRNIFLERP